MPFHHLTSFTTLFLIQGFKSDSSNSCSAIWSTFSKSLIFQIILKYDSLVLFTQYMTFSLLRKMFTRVSLHRQNFAKDNIWLMWEFCIDLCCFLIRCDIYVSDIYVSWREGWNGPMLQKEVDKVLTSLGTLSSRIMALISLRLNSARDLG